MASYCEYTDIEKNVGVKFTQIGRPSREDVEAAIENQSAELDGMLQAAGYTVPITNVDALRLLKHYTTMCTSCAVWNTGWLSQVAPARASYWNDQCEGFKARLTKGQQQLPGLTPEGSTEPVFKTVALPDRDNFFHTK